MSQTFESLKAAFLFPIRFYRYLRRADIEKDAEINVDTCAARTRAILGSPRPFDPVNDPEHAALAQDANTDADIEECRADLVAQERERAKHWPLWVLALLFAIVFLVEAVSCIQVFVAQGDGMPERALFGIGLAALFFVLAYVATKLATTEDVEVSK